MKDRPFHELAWLLIAALVATTAPSAHAQKAYPLHTYREAVDKAIAEESLRATAAKTTDSEVWLGLAYLAQVGSPVRGELLDKAVKAKPEYAPIAGVLAIAMDGSDEKSVDELIRRDLDNALGYYLQAELLYQQRKATEALAAFRKAAACPELRLYENTTAAALFKALDALNLAGRDRLCTASWMATRSSNFKIICLQPLYRSLRELAGSADLGTRKAISELLLVLGGQLYATDFENRTFAQRAVMDAFQLKAEIAHAEKSPTVNGYVAVVQALVSVQLSWPGIEDRKQTPLELAQFVEGRISRAFAMVDPAKRNGAYLVELRARVPDSDKARFDQAKANAVKAAGALIDAALVNPDEVIGAYLKGLPPTSTNRPRPWVSQITYVERLMMERPEVFRAAAANEEAMRALSDAGRSDPVERNMSRLMEIGLGILEYASDHSNTCPPTVSVLFEKEKYLKASQEAKSVLTSKPYVYVAGGKRVPELSRDRGRFILLYDDTATPGGNYQCVMGDSHGESMSLAELKQQLANQGK
jgi:tetratricopeptide (TPR) repeat protein